MQLTDSIRAYSAQAHESANHAIDQTEIMVGLTSEHGEVLEEIKRMIRNGGNLTNQVKSGVKMECGDCLWYMSEAAALAGESLSDLYVFAVDAARIYHGWPNISPLLAALKMVASSGQIAEILADSIILGSQLDRRNGQHGRLLNQLIQSLAWMLVLLDIVQIPLQEVMSANIEKLAERARKAKLC